MGWWDSPYDAGGSVKNRYASGQNEARQAADRRAEQERKDADRRRREDADRSRRLAEHNERISSRRDGRYIGSGW